MAQLPHPFHFHWGKPCIGGVKYPDFGAVEREGREGNKTKEKTGPLKHGKWNALRTYGPKEVGELKPVYLCMCVCVCVCVIKSNR